jgi:predicted DNA-binding transcriptional regulator AlpA
MSDATVSLDAETVACLRTPAASRYLGIPESTLTKLRCQGTGPAFVRLTAKSIGYRKCDLDAFLAARVVSPTADRSSMAA